MLFVPYSVDKRTKLVPFITYALITANILLFIVSASISNYYLKEDRVVGETSINTLLKDSPEEKKIEAYKAYKAEIGDPISEEEEREIRQTFAFNIAARQIGTSEAYKQLWQIEHAYDTFVLVPHYTVMNTLAYRPNNPSPLARFISMFSAMFMHANLGHIFSNLLLLWVFGRAAEEFLGRKFFSSIYFITGIGATLIDHLISQLFSPLAMKILSVGASGAIAGVLGLFVIRYYRTNIRVFYLMFYAQIIFGLLTFFFYLSFNGFLDDSGTSVILSIITSGIILLIGGRKWAWGAFWAPSAYVIGVWVVVFNFFPALYKMATGGVGGVAYWAHIGGFALGAGYALFIGGIEEGKDEYKLEDAKTALQMAGSDVAMNHAMSLLQKDPNNSAAHEVMAQAYDRRNSPELALRHYQKSMETSLKSNDGEAFLKTYNLSLAQHPNGNFPPRLLWHVARFFTEKKMWNETATILTRIIETYPDSEEAELALLRSAQIWGREFNEPAEMVRQLELFLEKYPNSVHEVQAKAALNTARTIISRQNDSPT
jgi:membrane associated rhomboid family serine protease